VSALKRLRESVLQANGPAEEQRMPAAERKNPMPNITDKGKKNARLRLMKERNENYLTERKEESDVVEELTGQPKWSDE
jgi:hypothetical protein